MSFVLEVFSAPKENAPCYIHGFITFAISIVFTASTVIAVYAVIAVFAVKFQWHGY